MIVLICNAETKTHSFFKAQIRYFCLKVNWELLNHSVYSKKGLKFQPPPPPFRFVQFLFSWLPFSSFDGLSDILNTCPYFFWGGSSTNCTRQALYLLLTLHLKWINVAFPAIWRVRLSWACEKQTPNSAELVVEKEGISFRPCREKTPGICKML